MHAIIISDKGLLGNKKLRAVPVFLEEGTALVLGQSFKLYDAKKRALHPFLHYKVLKFSASFL